MDYRTTITIAGANATPEEVERLLEQLVALAPDAGAAASQNTRTGEAAFVLTLERLDASFAAVAAAELVARAIALARPAKYSGHVAGVTVEPASVATAAA